MKVSFEFRQITWKAVTKKRGSEICVDIPRHTYTKKTATYNRFGHTMPTTLLHFDALVTANDWEVFFKIELYIKTVTSNALVWLRENVKFG